MRCSIDFSVQKIYSNAGMKSQQVDVVAEITEGFDDVFDRDGCSAVEIERLGCNKEDFHNDCFRRKIFLSKCIIETVLEKARANR